MLLETRSEAALCVNLLYTPFSSHSRDRKRKLTHRGARHAPSLIRCGVDTVSILAPNDNCMIPSLVGSIGGLPLLADGCSDSNLANDLAAVAQWLVLVKSVSE